MVGNFFAKFEMLNLSNYLFLERWQVPFSGELYNIKIKIVDLYFYLGAGIEKII